MKFFARKVGMTQAYSKDGQHLPVTVLELLKSTVVGTRQEEKDGYAAGIVARIDEKHGKNSRSLAGQFPKTPAVKQVIEDRQSAGVEIGKSFTLEQLKEGEKLIISGRGKGKGFAGTIKRHGFSRGPKTHGSHNIRQPGSIGSTYPERVVKGRRMPGHLGSAQTKVKAVEIVKILPEQNQLWVKGPVPGANKSKLILEK